MAELETETGTDTPDAPASDDYFSGHTQLVNDDGTPAAPEAADPAKPAAKAAPAAKPGEKPVEGDDGLKEVPDDFHGRFFEKDDKGVVAFKGEDAVKFLFPEGENATRFKYQPIHVEPDDPNKPVVLDRAAERKKVIDAEKEYRKNLTDNLSSPLRIIRDAMSQGRNPQESLALAEQQIREAIQEHLAERQLDVDDKRREQYETEGTTKAEMAELKARAATNEAMFYQEVGGKEAFDHLFFGRVKDGKHQPGIGSEDVWMLFKMCNPDVQTSKLTGKQLNDKMGDWWTRTAANRESLAFAYKIVKGTLTERLRPYLISKTRETALRQNNANREGNIKRGMGLRAPAKNPKNGADRTLDAFLNPAASREDIADI